MNLSKKKSQHRPSILYQAACLPWRERETGKGSVEVMLITSLGTRRWVLPKGTVSPGETARAAAKREAVEEAGIEGLVDARPLGSYFYEKQLSSGAIQICSVAVYPMKVTTQRMTWPEQDLRKIEWFAPAAAANLVAEEDLKDLLLAFDPVDVQPARTKRRA